MSTESTSPLVLGLDIGGTKSAAVLGRADGTILRRLSAGTPQDSWQEAVRIQIGLLHGVMEAGGVGRGDIAGMGVSCGGPLDSKTGVVMSPPNLPKWDNVPLKDLLTAEFGVPVQVENDANATAVAEFRWGAGVGARDMAFLTMGTGIGAGLILNGRLYRGRTDLAGELGHATVLPGGPLCSCGRHGCLEALSSGTAITREGRRRFDDPSVTGEVVCDLARAGDPVACEIVAAAAHWMGVGLANLLQTLNLERIVLGTLAVKAADLFMDPIRQATRANCWDSVYKGVTIVPAGLGDATQDMAALAVALPE